MAQQYPVVTVTGPRQSGKTTAVCHSFPEKPYVNLEAPDIRAAVLADPRRFLSQYPNGAVFDEIQHVPDLLSYIQVEVDVRNEEGRYILTGSYHLGLSQAISQSLAGRTAVLHLMPLSFQELSNAGLSYSLDEWLLQGFFPRVHAKKINPYQAYRNYVQTYLERDVRQLHHIRDLNVFQKFIRLCAGRVGSVLNKDHLSNELGISVQTVQSWLSVLEASYLIIQIQPYFENFGKRIIKSPKLYFTDVGLAAYLLGIEDAAQMSRDPLRGHLVENLVVMDLIKARLNAGWEHNLYYYRDSHQNEVDLIFKKSHQLYPIEIKASETFHPSFLKGIRYYQRLIGERSAQGYLVYAGDFEQSIDDIVLVHYLKAAEKIMSL